MEDGEREGVAVQERGMGVAGEAGGGADFHWDFGPNRALTLTGVKCSQARRAHKQDVTIQLLL
jgi:hypothetical protein